MTYFRRGNGSPLSLAFLLALTLLVYWPVGGHDFVGFDDPAYVTENPAVMTGLSWEGLRWAFSSFGYAGNSDPLTWLSHMLDVELFGMEAGRHHLVSLLLHLISSLLLAMILTRITGSLWRSTFVAALFSIHPLHVESVAWIAERKDVMSGLFWMLTMGAYFHYVSHQTTKRYFIVAGLFTMSLLSKPMTVTLPLALLLLDYWPLRRFGWCDEGGAPHKTSFGRSQSTFVRLLAEKVPLLALSAVYSAVTYFSQLKGGAVLSLERLPLTARLANALLAYTTYLRKTFWPRDLAIFYPLPETIPSLWQIAGAGIFIALVTLLVILGRKRAPYLLVGWFWYLGTLVPVIGIVQIGWFSMADRFTYIPLIGVFLASVWGVEALFRKAFHPLAPLAAGAAVVVVCVFLSSVQVRYWQDSLTLFRHTLEATGDNWVAEYHYGGALTRDGRHDEAQIHYQRSIELRSSQKNVATAHTLTTDNPAEPAADLESKRKNRVKRPFEAKAHLDRGHFLVGLQRFSEAAAAYERALEHWPDHPEALNGLGTIHFKTGRKADARAAFARVLSLYPTDFTAHFNSAVLLEEEGRLEEALNHYREALKVNPDDMVVLGRMNRLPHKQGDGVTQEVSH